MNLDTLLDAVCAGKSDNKTAQKLNISRVTFSKYRNKRSIPNNDVLDKFIKETGFNPVLVYAVAYAERIDNKEIAKSFREILH
jgi:transcriptional regulator with XRE-family HTH domain